MTVAPARPRPPMVLDEIEVVDVQRLSPTFVRVGFTSPALADFGVTEGPLLDQRIKLIFPESPGVLPSFDAADESWYASWLARPLEQRGHMRTFTVRRFVPAGPQSRLEVDFALHDGEDCGPAARWAATASVGDRIVLLGPSRGRPYGGIEFCPGAASEVLLAGDETAVPAVSAIVEQGLAGRPASVFLEVPQAADVLDLAAPPGVTVTWLPRGACGRGELLLASVVRHLGGRGDVVAGPSDDHGAEGEALPWETPTYSSSGEPVGSGPVASPTRTPHEGLYAWVAGESRVVTAIRRHLVHEVGLDRRQVAFMGYWREGVAMRS